MQREVGVCNENVMDCGCIRCKMMRKMCMNFQSGVEERCCAVLWMFVDETGALRSFAPITVFQYYPFCIFAPLLINPSFSFQCFLNLFAVLFCHL